ncbi:hypothetical protein CsSME_00048633 [Camellia sinensis var. sinensis]|uniref:Copper transport protein n=1 Tax=Camellia sinensis var. sinensis TaxID=542762 RepID=A0A4S4DH78_CAMSN|nr:copper transporter 5.1-like [Camellia sinensis]THG02122.1 hypothetical protein TEA_020154 [Camellia sinensis var. sinensis]
MMHMTFYWGRKVTLLLDSWKTETWTEYALTLCACLLFSVFYQYLEDRRLRFKLILSSLNNKTPTPPPPPPSPSIIDDHHTPLLYHKLLSSSSGGRWSPARFAGALLFGVNSALGYLLMLAVMSFNAGVFLAIVVGLAFGYLLFRSADQDLLLLDNPCACA